MRPKGLEVFLGLKSLDKYPPDKSEDSSEPLGCLSPRDFESMLGLGNVEA